MAEDFKKGINVNNSPKTDEAEKNVTEKEFTAEETKAQIRANEEDFIQGLIKASDYVNEEAENIEIARGGEVLFAFHIRALSDHEYNRCREKATKYVRNKRLGMTMPDQTDTVKYQSKLIYAATIKKDREKLWDNHKVWDALVAKGLPIACGEDVIEYTLKAGEKDRIIQEIDKISGFDSNLEEVAKN